MAEDYNEIGAVQNSLNNFHIALDYYNQALKIHEELNDRVWLAKDYYGLGNVFKNSREYDKALKHHTMALKIHEELADKLGMAKDLYNMISCMLIQISIKMH